MADSNINPLSLNLSNLSSMTKEEFNKLSPDQKEVIIKILQEYQVSGYSSLLESIWLEDYEEIPVDVQTFITNDRYLGKSTRNGESIYPFWKEQFNEIFDPVKDYSEVVLTGAIGIGKTRTAVVCLCYLLYKIMCLRNPQDYFNFNEGDEIAIVFFNITLELAEGVGFNTMHEYLLNSPWFMERGVVTGKNKLRYNPGKKIVITFGSTAGHALGKQIYGALLDEIDFAKGANVNMEQSKIMSTYNSVKERINSRFIKNGKLLGRLFLVSSKKSEHDFLESYVRKMKSENPHMFVVDEPLWVVKPKGTYCGDTFNVAVGNKLLPSRVLSVDENSPEVLQSLRVQGYEILPVPIEFRQSFILDVNNALMNLAGRSVIGTTSFFNYELFSKCYLSSAKNPFTTDVLTIGLQDDLSIAQFFIPNLIPKAVWGMPLFLHIDASLTGDRTGISGVAISGKKQSTQYAGAQEIVSEEICYLHVFTVGIQAPKGSEISLEKTRQFIYYLREIGLDIYGVSLDGFQSADTKQILISRGFKAEIISLDKTPDGYLSARSAMNDGRIGMIRIELMETEMVQLQRDNVTGKIDHPIEGSKDLSDSFAGAIYNASKHKSTLAYSLSLLDVAEDINNGNNPVEQYRQDFAEVLLQTAHKTAPTMATDKLNELLQLDTAYNFNPGDKDMIIW